MFIQIFGIVAVGFFCYLQYGIGYQAGRQFELDRRARELQQEADELEKESRRLKILLDKGKQL